MRLILTIFCMKFHCYLIKIKIKKASLFYIYFFKYFDLFIGDNITKVGYN